MPLAGHCCLAQSTCPMTPAGEEALGLSSLCQGTLKTQFLYTVQSTPAQTGAGPGTVVPHWCAELLISACAGLNSALKWDILDFAGERLVLHGSFQRVPAARRPQAPSLPKPCSASSLQGPPGTR